MLLLSRIMQGNNLGWRTDKYSWISARHQQPQCFCKSARTDGQQGINAPTAHREQSPRAMPPTAAICAAAALKTRFLDPRTLDALETAELVEMQAAVVIP